MVEVLILLWLDSWLRTMPNDASLMYLVLQFNEWNLSVFLATGWHTYSSFAPPPLELRSKIWWELSVRTLAVDALYERLGWLIKTDRIISTMGRSLIYTVKETTNVWASETKHASRQNTWNFPKFDKSVMRSWLIAAAQNYESLVAGECMFHACCTFSDFCHSDMILVKSKYIPVRKSS